MSILLTVFGWILFAVVSFCFVAGIILAIAAFKRAGEP